jgi:hypothetical protein
MPEPARHSDVVADLKALRLYGMASAWATGAGRTLP